MLSFFKLRTSDTMTILPPTPIPHSECPDSFIGAMIPPIFQVISLIYVTVDLSISDSPRSN